MAARKPLAAGLAKPLPGDTPTHITAILNRIGKQERAQRRLINRLDALARILENLQAGHGQLASYLHQELAEIRVALMEGAAGVSYSGDVTKFDWEAAVGTHGPYRGGRCQGWPVGNHGPEIDVDALAQEVHDARHSASCPSTAPVTATDIAAAKRAWPGCAFLGQQDLIEFARAVRSAAPHGVVELPIDKLLPRPSWLRRQLSRFLFRSAEPGRAHGIHR